MSKTNTRESLLSYSNIGVFSIQGGKLASTWSMRAISGSPIPREDAIRIFSSKLGKDPDSPSKVTARVRILNSDLEGATELQLLEHASLRA